MNEYEKDPFGSNKHLKPPIPSRVTRCSTCGAAIHFPLEPLYEDGRQVAALYTCNCLPRDMKDLDPVIRILSGGLN